MVLFECNGLGENDFAFGAGFCRALPRLVEVVRGILELYVSVSVSVSPSEDVFSSSFSEQLEVYIPADNTANRTLKIDGFIILFPPLLLKLLSFIH
jgi:hypothetical protein